MRWVLEPLARWSGIKEKRNVVRFAEQGYALCYAGEFENRVVWLGSLKSGKADLERCWLYRSHLLGCWIGTSSAPVSIETRLSQR